MKRIILIATAATMLFAATVAFAATTPISKYKATYSFSPSKSGTKKKPQKVSFTQKITVTPGIAGSRAGILHNIKQTLYGLKVDGKHFPTCTTTKIDTAKTDAGCPKGALVATGSIKAVLGSGSSLSSPVLATCDPLLHVWNAGQGKLAFFFIDTPTGTAHACAGLKTGDVAPYPATYKQSGKNLVVNVPIPQYVDYPAPNVVGSLQSENLKWKGTSSKGHISIASVACKGKKRPYSTSFTASNVSGPSQVATVKGSASCKKSK